MKTQKELLQQHNSYTSETDFFGFKRNDLVDYLTFKNAKPFLKEGVTAKDWKPQTTTKDAIIKIITEYMEFAWNKANNCRGLSAGRSIDHMEVWLWLLDDKALQKKFDTIKYEHYGKEKLIVICEHLNIDWKQYDDGVRTNTDE